MFKQLLSLPLLALRVAAVFPTQLIYQSPTDLWLENLAVRPSGHLLITSAASPTLYTLDPTSQNATLDEVHTFPNSNGLMGIVEYQPDVYAVVAATLNLTVRRAAPGSVSVWRLNFTASTHPEVAQVAVVSNTTMLNGLSTVPGSPDAIIASASVTGSVFEINMTTGATRVAIQDASMAPDAAAPALGINGLHIHDGALYYTNSQLETFARIPVTLEDGQLFQAGDAEVLGTVQPEGPDHQFDDFTFDAEGRAWVSAHPGALTLFSEAQNGTWVQENAAGDPEGSYAVFTEPTSAAFGRGDAAQEQILYVTTAGGQVVAVDTSDA